MRINRTAPEAPFLKAMVLIVSIILLMFGRQVLAETPGNYSLTGNAARTESNALAKNSSTSAEIPATLPKVMHLRQTFTFNPVADAHVTSSSASSNYGTSKEFRVELTANADYDSYLKFNVSGIAGTVVSAKLRLYVTSDSDDGGKIYLVSNNYKGTSTPWLESGINWNNAPAIGGVPLSQAGAIGLNVWFEFDVTTAISGDGTYSFGISNNSKDAAKYNSKEGSNKPQLVIETGQPGNSPVAGNDAVTTNEDTPVVINILANDSDPDGTLNPASVVIVNQPANGSITSINPATGAVTYTPNANYFGNDVFSYSVKDNSGASSNTATVTVAINSVNDAPVAVNDAATTVANTAVVIDVLANDSDIDGSLNPATVTIVNYPGSGSISGVNPANGKITYTPGPAFQGSDAFTYTVQDNSGAVSNTVTVSVTVNSTPPSAYIFNPVADAHVTSSSASSNYGTSKEFRVELTANADYDSYLKFNVSGIAGTVVSAKLRLYVTSDSDDGGKIYLVSNNYKGTSTPWLESGINWSNAPAIGGAPLSQAGAIGLNVWFEFDVTTAISGDGTYSFGISNNSKDAAKYNSKEGSNKPQLVIETGQPGNSPVAGNDAVTTNEDTPVVINILANDSDPDGTLNPASVVIVNQPANGSITSINPATGAVTYTPNANYFGNDVFSYSVKDNSGASSNTATVTITINSVNDAPVANNDAITTPKDASIQIPVLANDIDVDGTINPSTIAIVDPPFRGNISNINSVSGVITYVPNAGYEGTDFFRYTVRDNNGAISNTATVAITIQNSNGDVLIFSAMGDVPYKSSEVPTLLRHISDHNHYSPSEFMVHVGDIKDGASANCTQSVYSDMFGYLSGLSVPTFIVPGDNEWNDCANPAQAWNYWIQYFTDFEQNFSSSLLVERQSVRHENFAFVKKGVLLIGLNMPAGTVISGWDARLQNNADWVSQQFQVKKSQVRAAVIFSQAGPGGSKNSLFFNRFETAANDFDQPILFLHGDGHSWIMDRPFSNQKIQRIQVNNGGSEEPVEVTVLFNPQSMFIAQRNPLTSYKNVSGLPTGLLTVNTEGSGKVELSPPGATYETGTVVTLKANSAPGHQFMYWTGDLGGSNNPETITMDSDKNVKAVFRTLGPAGVVAHEESKTGVSSLAAAVVSNDLIAVEGDLYLAAITSKPKFAVTAVSGLGLNWTRLKTQCSGQNHTGVELWWAQGSPDKNGAVTAILFDAPANAAIAVSRYSGVDKINPIGNIISGNANGLNGDCSGGAYSDEYSFTIDATVNGSIIYSAAAEEDETHSPGIGFTERADVSAGTDTNSAGVAIQDHIIPTTATIAMEGTFSSIGTDWAVIAIEIRPQPGVVKQAHQEIDDVEVGEIPVMYELHQNYPNPFNPSTIIKFSLPEYAKVTIKLFNLSGKEIMTLVDGFFPAGVHKIPFRPEKIGSGVYIYELHAGEIKQTRRLVFVK